MTQTFGITLIFIMKSYYLNCIYVTPFLIIAQSLKNCNTKTYPILPQVRVFSLFIFFHNFLKLNIMFVAFLKLSTLPHHQHFYLYEQPLRFVFQRDW